MYRLKHMYQKVGVSTNKIKTVKIIHFDKFPVEIRLRQSMNSENEFETMRVDGMFIGEHDLAL